MPVLCWDRVRYVGDRVAAVAADTPEAAEEALRLIEVDYEQLPAVFDPLEASQARCPAAARRCGCLRRRAARQSCATDVHNGQTRLSYGKGDRRAGLSRRRPRSSSTHFIFRAAIRAIWSRTRASSLSTRTAASQAWCSSKAPFRARHPSSRRPLGIPEEQIQVNVTYVGGDFGGKGDARDLPIAYFLAKQAGRPGQDRDDLRRGADGEQSDAPDRDHD